MDQLTEIKKPIINEFVEFEKLFSDSFERTNPLQSKVVEVVSSTSGKMMRPILSLLIAKGLGSIGEMTYNNCISLELLHTASLIHDDVVDDSDMRRGKASVNSLFGDKIAVLFGDYLLATSLNFAAKSDISVVRAISSLGMCLSDGELLQLNNTMSDDFSYEQYYSVIRKKTAVLFSTASYLAAYSVIGDCEITDRCREFGDLLGVIFQIKDDILDYDDNAETGKPVHNDMHEGKLTLPALYYIQNSNDPSVLQTAKNIRSLQANDDEINDFVKKVKDAGGLNFAYNTLQEIRIKCLDLIPQGFPDEIRSSLLKYIDFIIERNK